MAKEKKEEVIMKNEDVEALIKSLDKGLRDYISKADNPELVREKLSTGIEGLDRITGGGYRKGLLHLFTGETNSGKTLIAYFAIVEAQKQGLLCAYIDVENRFDPEWATKIGVDISKLVLIKSREGLPLTGEAVCDTIIELIKKGIDLLIVDSLAAMMPMADYESSFNDPSMGTQQAKMIGKLYRELATINTKAVVIAINQLRTNVGGYSKGIESISPCGKAPPFYSSLITQVRKKGSIIKKVVDGETLYEREDSGGMKKPDGIVKAGYDIELFTEKCSFFPEYQKCTIPFNFYTGQLDHISSLFELAKDDGIILQTGAWYVYDGEKYQGKDGLVKYLEAHLEEVEKIKQQIVKV